jgi:hypothetical protein
VCTGFWWGNLRERYRLGDPGVNGRILLRRIFRKLRCIIVPICQYNKTVIQCILALQCNSGIWGYGLDRAGSG